MIQILANQRGLVVARLVFLGLLQAGATVWMAYTIRFAVSEIKAVAADDSLAHVSNTARLFIIGSFLALVIGRGALSYRTRVDAERLGQSLVHDVRLSMFDHLVKMPSRSVNEKMHGTTALRFSGDLSAIGKWASFGIAQLAVSATTVVVTLLLLWVLEPVLALVVLIAVLTSGLGSIVIGAGVNEVEKAARDRRAILTGRVTEIISGLGAVQALGASKRERNRMENRSETLRTTMVNRARRIGALRAVGDMSSTIAFGTLIVAAMTAQMSSASIAAGLAVVNVLGPKLRQLAKVTEHWERFRVGRDAIGRFMERPELEAINAADVKLPKGRGRLVFDNVSIAGHVWSLSGVIKPGTVVAVVGPNGAGKSTLASGIMGLLDIDEGSITLDGVPIPHLRDTHRRRAMGVVSNDLPLFRGSLKRNITYRCPKSTDEDLAKVIDTCGLQPLIDELPQGLSTKIVHGGLNLSAGQRQRVMLARALLGNPRLLLLDEHDANLDEATSAMFDRVIAARRRTTIMVTHDQRRLAAADLVWHIEGGILVETGTPEQVLNANGPTARLFAPPPRKRKPERRDTRGQQRRTARTKATRNTVSLG